MNSKKFYQRFVKDYNLPINVFEEGMFKYYMGLYDFFPSDVFDNTVKMIENDFHDRKDLSPNVCAVYTEEDYRGKGIAGKLLNMVVEDMRSKEITPIYLVTDHTGFYERYGWDFLCMVQGDGEPEMTRMYVHR